MKAGKMLENAFHALRSAAGAWKCRHSWKAIERKKVVFNQFQGGGFGCNPKYIALELLKRRRDLDLVWLVRNPSEGGFPDGVRKVEWKSAAAMRELATAHVWCANHNLGHFIKNRGLVKKSGQFYIQTWHGSFGIKRCTETLGRKEAAMLDVFFANCEWEAALAREWFAPAKPRIVCAGHPRNDIIVHSRAAGGSGRVSTGAFKLLYVPTFRDDGATDAYLTDFRGVASALARRFPGEWKIQARLHPNMRKKGVRFEFLGNVEDVTDYPDIQELLAEADAVISDYSSCMFDFALSGRPVFVYAPDREKYETDRGFYYPLDAAPFPVAADADALAAAILDFDEREYSRRLGDFFAGKGSAEDGHAAERAADMILAALDSAPPEAVGESYSVSLVSDTHYDSAPWEKYRDPSGKALKKRYERNLEMWKTRIPALLGAARRCRRADTAFVLHLGDIVNGEARDPAALRRMLEDGFSAHAPHFAGLPLQLVAGNHDVLCDAGDGIAAYKAWLGKDTNWTFWHGGDIWMIFDYNSPPDIATVEKWFAESENARWTFVVSHMPVVPCAVAGAQSILYHGRERAAARRRLRQLLAGRRRTVVLAAHVHSMMHSVFDFDGGRVVQFVVNSLWEKPELDRLEMRRIKRSKWCAKTDLLPECEREEFKALAAEYRPYLVSHETSHTAGHFLLEVDEKSVKLKIFGGSADSPAKTVVLCKR